ncbi:MAG: hypothetical protein ACRDO4_03035 [Nocardioides sp.]
MARGRLTLAASLLLLLAGCGLDATPLGDAPSPSRSATGATEPSASPADDASTPSRSTLPVRRAVRKLFLARTGRVTTTLLIGSDQVLDEARYDILRGFSFRRRLLSDDSLVVIEGVVLGNDLWYRVLEPEEIRCWIHATPEVLAGFSTRDVSWNSAAAARRPLLPNGLSVVSTFKGSSGHDSLGTHPGSTRLSLVVELLGAPALEASGLTRADRTRVVAEARIVNGRLVTVTVSGDELADALDEADADIDGADAATMKALISFSLEGSPVELDTPPPESVVELTTDRDGFEEDLLACERRQR